MAEKPLTKTQTAQLAVLQEHGPILFWRSRGEQCKHLRDPYRYPKLGVTVIVLTFLVNRGLVLRRDGKQMCVVRTRNKYIGTVDETYDVLIEFKINPKGRK